MKHIVLLLLLFCFPLSVFAQNDCPEALIVCGNDSYRGLDATGIGNMQEIGTNACNSNENNSLWLKILIKDGGTLGFVLTPDSPALVVDFDFWLFGPNVECGSLGTALRCSTTNPLQAFLGYNVTGMNAEATDISEGPGPNGNAWVNWITVQDDETYYLVIDRPVGSSNFSLAWTGTATFHDIPQFLNPDNIPLDISQCDNDGVDDDSVAFDLTVYEEMFIGNQTDVVVSYHLSQNDAIVGENPITSPEAFPNTSDPQIIHLRMVNTITGCFTTESFTIRIIPPVLIVTGQPQDLELCDDNNNGIGTFDLSINDDLILNGNDGYNVKYYTSQGNAANDINDIQAIFTNTIPYGPQTIWTRVERNDGCVGHSIVSFDLIVNPKPILTPAADYELCDDNTDGIATFDLTIKGDEITGGDTALFASYYATEADAQTETGAIANPTVYNNSTAGSQVIWVRVETAEGCFETASFNLVVNPLPVIAASVDYTECETSVGSGEGIFDLISQDAVITMGSSEYTVDYYNTLAHAQNEDFSGLLDSPYITTSRTVFVRVTNPITGCVSFGELNLEAVPAPVPGATMPLEACDNDAFPVNEYHGTFNLTPAINDIIGTQSGLTVTVHELLSEAENGLNDINNITSYINSDEDGFQTLYIRLEQGTNCYAVGTIELIVHPIPAIGVLTDYPLCDDNNSPDGLEIFDLTTKDAEVTNGVAGLIVTYHESAEDAAGDINAIANLAAYQNANTGVNEQTIYVRLESAFGCYSTDSFQIIVNPLPGIDTSLPPLTACEEEPGMGVFTLTSVDTVVTMNSPGYNVSYYETFVGAQTAGEPAIDSPYLSPEKTIFVRVEDDQTGCISVTTLDLEVLPAPIAATPAPIEECDDNNDNVAIFDMTEAINDIINDLGTVTVTVHETIEDATFDANPLINTDNYSNVEAFTTGGVQVVFIRVESGTTPCFDIVELQLIVRPRPEAVTPEDFEVCDDNTDGIAVFDLSTIDSIVLGTMDPAQFTVEYYDELADAQNGVSAITNPVTYASATDLIYVRVENNATGCYDIVELQLIVNPLPDAVQPTPYTLCDNDNPGNEREIFDLTTKIPEIIEAQEGINVTFHQTMADAMAGINEEANPTAYTNNETVETLFVRVETEATGCYRVVLLDVRVEPIPLLLIPQPEDLTICDPDTNGIATFDLNAVAEILINDGENIELSFYETMQNAIDDMFPIPNTDQYTNENPFTQVLYVVAANTMTGCKSNPLMIELEIVASPLLPDLEDLVMCDEDNQNQNGIARFNLAQQTDVLIAGGLDPSFIYHYFTSLANAEAGAPRITNPGTFNGTDNQTIWVRVEDPLTDCYSIESFQLQVGTPLLLVTPPMYTVCNSELPNDTTEVFDLTTMDNTILGPQGVGQGFTVEYYENQADALSDSNAIVTPEAYANEDNPQTLFVAVTTLEGCRSYTTLTIKVLPLPTPDTTPAALELCDDNNSPDGEESFNLTLAEADIRDNDNSTTVTYHTSMEDAEADTNAIADPTNHVSATGTVYVRVEANTNNPLDPKCYQVVELSLIVNPLPALGDNGVIPPYAICEPLTDGFAEFDLNTWNEKVISGGDTTGYTFRYFRTLADEANNTNAIPLEDYTNQTAGQQTIFVRVVNTATGCKAVGTFDLLVELEAVAHDVPDDLICDQADGNNDGIAAYDLTQLNAIVLGGQDPVQYIVEYYTAGQDPENNPDATPIADPANFRNEGSPDMVEIIIRVYNDATISKCSDYTSVTIHVERLPEPVLTGGTICVDFRTGEVVRTHTLDTQLDDTHTFVWYHDGVVIPGAAGPTYEAAAEGDYTVIATSANGCVSVPITPVTVLQSGPPSLIGTGYSVSNYFSDDQVITINVEGFGTYEYRLDDGPWQESNVFTNVSAGSHQVQVRDASADNPCSEFVLTIEGVSTVDYPKFFTPNADNWNDYWNIKGLGDDNTDAKIYIFDRYGKLVKQISSQGDGWDGTMNGMLMPATDYWFRVIYRETVNGVETIKEFKAHFSLKR